jgi:hypothetical protein
MPPPVLTQGGTQPDPEQEAHMRPVLRLVMGGRGMSTAHRRQLGVPAPAVLRPTLLVIEGGRHATGPR